MDRLLSTAKKVGCYLLCTCKVFVPVMLFTESAYAQLTKKADSNYYMQAEVDGVAWHADALIIDEDNSTIVEVHGKRQKSFLKFSLYKPVEGKEKKFSETSPANWADDTDLDIYVGETGSAVVTKMNDNTIEGTFSFTARCNGKMIAITRGKFRIPNPYSLSR